MPAEKTVYAFLFPTAEDVAAKTRQDASYRFNSASFDVRIVEIRDGAKIRNIGDDSPLDDLALRVFLWRREDSTLDPSVNLEWRDVYSVDFARVASMAKFAATVSRKLDKFNAADGYATEWGETFRRIAVALGVTKCVRRRGTSRGFQYDDNAHEIRPIASAVEFAEAIRAAVDPIVPQREQSAAA